MNVFKQNTVSEHPLQRSLTGFPKLSKKKNRKPQKLTIIHQMEHKNCNKDKYLNNFTVFDHITDENNIITPSI